MSFLDAFQGYNQIRLAHDDQEKNQFRNRSGHLLLQCYAIRSKKCRSDLSKACKQHVPRTDREEYGSYIDDMMVKSQKKENHKQDLQECFDILQHFGMKLNPTKCTFGVHGGKFLGFMISQRGIEANPEKIKAILEMKPPRTIQEVQRLTGRLAALNRFISRSSDRGLPFFKVLKKIEKFQWTPQCQEAFEKLKEYLASPLLLTKPKDEETLYLYLATSQGAINAVLTRKEGRDHHPVYYVSKTLQRAEEKYPPSP
ncbi:UNVERIFIED_CONTAM: hypothetical protein Sradi_6538700 [Sesamum radiatum]|uniref:Reverse transcriptase/retrotransposon-derived protein RNase H-like domain-containing protein n=1 Tax=Sesamum radiatum TaxID=300843 RepID=A0AAW2JVY2_SESRA